MNPRLQILSFSSDNKKKHKCVPSLVPPLLSNVHSSVRTGADSTGQLEPYRSRARLQLGKA